MSLTVPDAVILGVDSTVSLPGLPKGADIPLPANVIEWARGPAIKAYDGAEKLFALGNRPVGVAIYGTTMIGDRSIRSHLHEFVTKDPDGVLSRETSLQQIAEGLRAFFANLYEKVVKPFLQDFRKMPFDQIPVDQRPGFGFVIGGYSANAYLPEVFHVFVPTVSEPQVMRRQRELNANWFGLYEPIDRYYKGYTQPILNSLLEQFEKIHGSALSEQNRADINALLATYEYPNTISLMPVSVGIEYVRFLVGLVINHYRFDVGIPLVGGSVRIGKATCASGTFEVLE